MGGRGGSSGLSGGGLSLKDISKRLPDQRDFQISKVVSLQGSEKQIKWANDIRKSLAIELANYAAYYTDNGKVDTNNMFRTALSGKDAMAKDVKNWHDIQKHEPNATYSTAQVSEYNRNLVANAIGKYKNLSDRIQRFNQISGEKSAKWWIENRNNVRELKEYIDGKRKKPM